MHHQFIKGQSWQTNPERGDDLDSWEVMHLCYSNSGIHTHRLPYLESYALFLAYR